jgi:hypothetical protein
MLWSCTSNKSKSPTDEVEPTIGVARRESKCVCACISILSPDFKRPRRMCTLARLHPPFPSLPQRAASTPRTASVYVTSRHQLSRYYVLHQRLHLCLHIYILQHSTQGHKHRTIYLTITSHQLRKK